MRNIDQKIGPENADTIERRLLNNKFAVIVLVFVVKENPNSYSFWLMIGRVVFIVFLLGTVAVQIVIMNEITRIRELVEGESL